MLYRLCRIWNSNRQYGSLGKVLLMLHFIWGQRYLQRDKDGRGRGKESFTTHSTSIEWRTLNQKMPSTLQWKVQFLQSQRTNGNASIPSNSCKNYTTFFLEHNRCVYTSHSSDLIGLKLVCLMFLYLLFDCCLFATAWLSEQAKIKLCNICPLLVYFFYLLI